MQAVKAAIGPKTKLVSLVHVSNMLGAILPTEDIVRAAHEVHLSPTQIRPCMRRSHSFRLVLSQKTPS